MSRQSQTVEDVPYPSLENNLIFGRKNPPDRDRVIFFWSIKGKLLSFYLLGEI
jgi:hypothetical protein